ncbi:aspartic proteinase nepenthesin-1-like [Wolffia australiana]
MAGPRSFVVVIVVGLLLRLLAASAWSLDRLGGAGCDRAGVAPTPPLRFHLRRPSEEAAESAARDRLRLQTVHRSLGQTRGTRKKRGLGLGLVPRRAMAQEKEEKEESGLAMARLESGVSLGSGEYMADVFVGTPARHFSVILDTGSDLNWLQCAPCDDCFEQHGPLYDPALSSSYQPVRCDDPLCALVSSSAPRSGNGSCAYAYSYGDRSNTSGDLALETFTVNLTAGGAETRPRQRRVEGVVFGCGRRNRGLFRGAGGLLGLGRGPLSFFSQLRPVYGGVFSYCFVPRDSDLSVSSRLVFGEDRRLLARPGFNFTAFAANKSDTFYYVDVRGVKVGGRLLDVAPEVWALRADGGGGGTILDSGSTLSYLPEQAYRAIQRAVLEQVRYPVVEGLPVLSPCFDVAGAARVELPDLVIVFADGAEWRVPHDNYFVTLGGEGEAEVVCLAMLPTPTSSSFAILGNYLQQNFLVVYDVDRSRLGIAPADCAHL